MNAKPSELVMDLLKELASIKELDERYEKGPRSEVETEEFELRQKRRREIGDQIKTLAESTI